MRLEPFPVFVVDLFQFYVILGFLFLSAPSNDSKIAAARVAFLPSNPTIFEASFVRATISALVAE